MVDSQAHALPKEIKQHLALQRSAVHQGSEGEGGTVSQGADTEGSILELGPGAGAAAGLLGIEAGAKATGGASGWAAGAGGPDELAPAIGRTASLGLWAPGRGQERAVGAAHGGSAAVRGLLRMLATEDPWSLLLRELETGVVEALPGAGGEPVYGLRVIGSSESLEAVLAASCPLEGPRRLTADLDEFASGHGGAGGGRGAGGRNAGMGRSRSDSGHSSHGSAGPGPVGQSLLSRAAGRRRASSRGPGVDSPAGGLDLAGVTATSGGAAAAAVLVPVGEVALDMGREAAAESKCQEARVDGLEDVLAALGVEAS